MDPVRPPSRHALRAADIGYLARQTVAAARRAKVLGTTSRGLFLQSAGRWLIFLSYERYRSPLTINMASPTPALQSVDAGDDVLLHSDHLTFPTADADVLLPDETWRPAAPRAVLRPFADRVEGLKKMAAAVPGARQEQELGLLLRPLLSLPRETPLPEEQRSLLALAIALQGRLRDGDGDGAAAVAGRLLGRGRGLTASGDDFLIGLLLFANRHPAAVRPSFAVDGFSRAVVDAAYEATTTISANLLECAADGHGDERVMDAADSIATGIPDPGECLPPLLSWGASSGVDALAGMTCAATL